MSCPQQIHSYWDECFPVVFGFFYLKLWAVNIFKQRFEESAVREWVLSSTGRLLFTGSYSGDGGLISDCCWSGSFWLSTSILHGIFVYLKYRCEIIHSINFIITQTFILQHLKKKPNHSSTITIGYCHIGVLVLTSYSISLMSKGKFCGVGFARMGVFFVRFV